jgi:hypothetical protein
MKYTFSSICLLGILIHSLSAQDKHDYTWLLGYHKVGLNPPGTMFNFNESPMEISPTPLLGGLKGAAIMSDTAGKLLFYSDGCMIINAKHQMMTDGDSINGIGGANFRQSCIKDSVGYNIYQGLLALPYPNRDNMYLLFQIASNDGDHFPDELLYSLIDMNLENGLGRVIRKNVFLSSGRFADGITAVRHGNGRDWWIVAAEEDDTYHLVYLSPAGIEIKQQKIGYTTLALKRWANNCAFSPDGTKYARLGQDYNLLRMDFDRCAGRFSCPKFTKRVQNYSGGGLAFSPNSKYLYISYREVLFQLDAESTSEDPKTILVGEYDGFAETLPATFFRMMLAPDHKIYMCCTNGISYMHVINAPDSLGVACDLRQHAIKLYAPNTIGIHNFPFFRLYDQPRSVCDSLGIDAPQGIQQGKTWTPEKGVRAYPNPVSDYLYIALSACARGRMQIVDATGRVMYFEKNWQGPKSTELSVAHWPAGVYFLQIHQYESIQYVQKIVVMH